MTTMKHCVRCGKRLPASRPRLFSRFSHSYYCADVDLCNRRVRRLNKLGGRR
jgi:hypothetical protein